MSFHRGSSGDVGEGSIVSHTTTREDAVGQQAVTDYCMGLFRGPAREGTSEGEKEAAKRRTYS